MSRWTAAIARARSTSARVGRSAVTHARSRSAIPVWAALVGVAAAAAALVAIGALDEAPPSPAHRTAGETVTLSHYAVTVLEATLTDSIEEEYLDADPGNALAVLTARLENLSDTPIGVGTTTDRLQARLVSSSESLLELSGVAGADNAYVFRSDGSFGTVILQPRVPAEVVIAWEVPADAFPEDVLVLDAHEPRITTGQAILSADTVTWRQADLAARITVDLERRR